MFKKMNKSLYVFVLIIIFLSLISSGCSVNTEITADTNQQEKTKEIEIPKETETQEETVKSEEEILPVSTVNWSVSTHSNDVEPNYDIVFNQTEVLEFNIVIGSDDWKIMQDDLQKNMSSNNYEPIWVTSTVTFNNNTWDYVGIRYKGNSSLRSVASSGNGKLSFKLDFDEFEDLYPEINNQRFYGFKQLNLNNNFSDMSQMHEKIGADLFREFGIAAAQTAFCIVNVDFGEGSQFFGLYTLVEEMDNTGIEIQYGDDSGNLYKPEGKAATFAARSYNDSEMEKKNNEDEADYSDVFALYEIINSNLRKTDNEAWKSDLEAIFNIDGFLKWLAANTVMQNWDTYGISPHNYYLYRDPNTNLINWIPWDNNEALTSGKKDKNALSLGLSEVRDSWPLIRYLIDDPSFKAIYDGYMQQFVNEVFYEEKMIDTYNQYFEMIKEYVYSERTGYTFLKSDESFNTAVEELKIHVEQRNMAVKQYLSNQ